VIGVNGTLVEAKMFTFTIECAHFIFTKCPIQTHDSANAKFSTIETIRITLQTISNSSIYRVSFHLLHGLMYKEIQSGAVEKQLHTVY
jgi:hypothetical protein